MGNLQEGNYLTGTPLTEGDISNIVGVWPLQRYYNRVRQGNWTIPVNNSIISSNLGFGVPTTQGNKRYYYAARKLTIFYTDAYGTITHINQTDGNASYTDVRNMANDQGDGNSVTFLSSFSGSYQGYEFDEYTTIGGFTVYGAYAGILLSNQGTLTVETLGPGGVWTERATVVGNTAVNSSPGLTQTFPSVAAKGIRIKHSSVSTYAPYTFFAATNGSSRILGLN